MRLNEFAQLGYSDATLKYPYRVKKTNGKITLVKDLTKGLAKESFILEDINIANIINYVAQKTKTSAQSILQRAKKVLKLDQIKAEDEQTQDVLQQINDALKNKTPQEQQQALNLIFLPEYEKLINEVVSKKFTKSQLAIKELVFEKIMRTAQTVNFKTIIDFLTASNSNGAVNTEGMIGNENTTPTPWPLTNKDYLPLVKSLSKIILGSRSAGGKGEIALAFAGSNAKQDKGDITISGKDIELKASDVTVTSAGQKTITDFSFDDEKVKAVQDTKGGQSLLIKTVQPYLPDVTNIPALNLKWISLLNDNVFQKIGREKTIDLFVKLFEKSYGGVKIDRDQISKRISKTGDVNYEAMLKLSAFYTFANYKNVKNFEGIMLINVDSMTYQYYKEPKTFAQQINGGVKKMSAILEYRSAAKTPTFKVL